MDSTKKQAREITQLSADTTLEKNTWHDKPPDRLIQKKAQRSTHKHPSIQKPGAGRRMGSRETPDAWAADEPACEWKRRLESKTAVTSKSCKM